MSCVSWVLDQILGSGVLLVNIIFSGMYPQLLRDAALTRFRENVEVLHTLKYEVS